MVPVGNHGLIRQYIVVSGKLADWSTLFLLSAEAGSWHNRVLGGGSGNLGNRLVDRIMVAWHAGLGHGRRLRITSFGTETRKHHKQVILSCKIQERRANDLFKSPSPEGKRQTHPSICPTEPTPTTVSIRPLHTMRYIPQEGRPKSRKEACRGRRGANGSGRTS